MKNFFVDEDITKATTLHTDFYSTDEAFELSKEKIFSHSWQFAGDVDEVKLPGQLVPRTLLPGFLDEPVLLSRSKEDELHCLSNVCTHRGNILVENSCIENQIRCRYHGRRFGMNGKFKHMPEFEGVQNFPSEKDDLVKIPMGQWGPWLFASTHPKMMLDEALGEMQKRLSFLPLHNFKKISIQTRDYLVKAHWALYCENYLEGFHIPFVHADLNAVIDYGTYTTELFRYGSLQLAPSKGGDFVFELPADSPDFGKEVAAYYYWIFPNLMFNFYPWGLSMNVVKPINKQLTKISFVTYLMDESKWNSNAAHMLDKVEREDEAIVENVQLGIHSRFYTGGRYSPKRETGTHHFHRLIAEFMNY
ncbi:MAG: aromatic ring-hydroxylating dioxygenase subunit alpha [Flavobacteriales bacterium]|nr:aromatic ring-hydroxylating dioxygenase subunit alpha [Flavobacteriales bacterium]